MSVFINVQYEPHVTVHQIKSHVEFYLRQCACIFWYAVASLGLGADSVIAVLQVIIASLTVYLVTVTKVVSHLVCVTQTLGGVSAR